MTRNKALATLLGAVLILILSSAVQAYAATDDDDEIKVRRVDMAVDSITVRVNQTRTLIADIVPRDADEQDLSWDSANWQIATVDGDGMVTGISPGTTEVTATSANGKVGRCTVTVPGAQIKSSTYTEDIKSSDLPQAAITGGEILRVDHLKADVEKVMKSTSSGQVAKLSYQNKTTVSSSALRGAAYVADSAGGKVAIKLQTMAEDGSVQGQLTIYPENTPSSDEDFKVSVYTDTTRLEADYTKAREYFNGNIAVIRLERQGDFGMEVGVAAKVDLTGISMDNAKVFHYANGSYSQVENANLWLDPNGFIHFRTTQGGAYVIA